MFHALLVSFIMTAAGPVETPAPERFIVLSEFQIWADPVGPETYRALNKLYLERGHCHSFNLYRRGKGFDYFIWDQERTKYWVDECVALGAFNVFCMGDDTRTGKGRLFTTEGVNPKLADVLFDTIAYAHQRGLMVSIEPVTLPKVRDEEHFTKWLNAWIGPDVPKARRADIIKLSIEWFGGWQKQPKNMAHELDAFLKACKKVNPEVLVYIDSIGGKWYRPQILHRWLLSEYPGTIVSHYLNTAHVDDFRKMGARNMMVQINPCEAGQGIGCHLFLYFDDTVKSLKDIVKKRVRYVSLAGVNYAYSRRDFDLFLDVIRPHLALASDVEALRGSIAPDEIRQPASKEEVRAEYSKVVPEKKP
ncbi:MAG: hypothetical protein JW888_07850 [Pirellulales bacterium]|nr:hypothetical protein [Pirellulales bacterium]